MKNAQRTQSRAHHVMNSHTHETLIEPCNASETEGLLRTKMTYGDEHVTIDKF